MIEYRKVTPEEKLYIARLQNMAFSKNIDEEQGIREQIAKGEYNCDETYGAIDENGQVLAGMEVVKYIMWFDGRKTDMYGIGQVASAPEFRRQGYVRKIFEKAFDDIYEKGAVFSFLFPFSYDYYRKFGYEHSGSVKKYSLPLAPARKLKNNGTAHDFIRSGDSVIRSKLISIYENYASRHNGMISRSEARWDEVFDIALFGADRLYYWKDINSDIKSWVKFRKNGGTMEILDIAWTDRESMLGILQFMGMFDGAAGRLSLRASPEFIPEIYWNDPYDVGTEHVWLGMNRIVNAKRALELMKKPDGEGKFTIKIADKFAKWNNNTYIVEYGGGDCSVKAAEAGVTPDAETSELALMQMILGVYEFDQIAKRDDVCVNGNMQTLEKVFRKKNILLAEHGTPPVF